MKKAFDVKNTNHGCQSRSFKSINYLYCQKNDMKTSNRRAI